ncbi:MAG: hypothetical protein U0441_23695 [Polyangiaceae bacterium]
MTPSQEELARRLALPQRHRLLQGYPMLPLMRAALDPAVRELRWGQRHPDGSVHVDAFGPDSPEKAAHEEEAFLQLDATRPLLVGVLPHSQCNPRVEGCGFCTFPHDRYNKGLLQLTAEGVSDQIYDLFAARPELRKRRVEGVYFGGATANLAPARTLSRIANSLAQHLDLSAAEVTLEGVPSLFRSLLRGPFEALLDMPARHRRISMGVQTFDEAMLARMGRAHFGGKKEVARVVDKAHRHGLTASGDFLLNLPSEPRRRMVEDVREAAAMGLDQICVYHLVLSPGHGTPWGQDPSVLAELPSVEQAFSNWLAVREELLGLGYVQSTLTNFERAEVHATDRRFVYETASFTPERYDALGFGPLSISTFTDPSRRRAVKFARGKSLRSWAWGQQDLYFAYDEEDLRLLHLTRTLCRLGVSLDTYQALFGAALTDHFGEVVEAVVDANLATLDSDLRLTPRGMFYADSVAGLFAWRRGESLREKGAGRTTRDLLDDRVRFNDFMG